MTHKHSAVANTQDCLRACLGTRVIGVLTNALPRNDRSRTTRTFILDCGCGFTFNTNGAFWLETPEDVRWAIDTLKRALEDAESAQRELLTYAEALDDTEALR